ncbi:ABATE domain-containing protein [Burkholderia sp. L27(2015)]|jgi:predicted RNA-binding Zn ribbon-like protein|uniref:CGNR zinc finger domain-containing protein n=1 Tax=Burkholderia sp. L27(2015) TaxID=1641858 RepID=UPI00131E88A5|nr:ABATE domain-containing protein [Burkholderia sp. L27(2015)]
MSAPEFLTLADDPALDFMNTLAQGEDGLYEYLATNTDVVAWMQTMGYLDQRNEPTFKREVLADTARALREVVRKLVFQRKAGKRVDISALNAFLVHAQYNVQLIRGADGALEVKHRYETDTPEQLLTQVAQAAAELLATGDFELVRKCEAPDCVLWFYDRTKSHRRRWCSMATCGNRHKVAKFRARQKSTGHPED